MSTGIQISPPSENFANADLTFTGNREHDTAGNTLQITTDAGGFGESFIYMTPTLNEIGTAGAYTDYTTRIDHLVSPTGTIQRIAPSGISIGFGAVDAQARLDVKAQGALSTDIAFRVRNSADTGNIMSIQGDGTIVIPAIPKIDTTAGTFLQTNAFESMYIGRGNSTISNYYNCVVGTLNTLSNSVDTFTVLGNSNNVAGFRNIVIGYGNRTSGDASIRIGYGIGNDTFGGNSSMHFGRSGMGSVGTYSANEVANFFFNDWRTSQMFRGNGSILLSGKNSQITTDANVTTFMGDGGNTLVVRNHTSVPTLNITDSFQQYSADIVAGNAAPHFRTELGDVIKLYKQSSAGITTVADLVTVLTNLGLLG